MARKAMILKQKEEPKFSTRYYNRCKICGRPHAYLRDYGVCRICFRELAYKGQIPGVRKASWQIFFRYAAFLIARRTDVRLRVQTLPSKKVFTNLVSEF